MRIPLPLLGLNDNLAYSEQPPTTTRDAVNCGSTDKQTNRVRFASRSGTSRFCPDRVGDFRVQFMGMIMSDSRKMAYSASAGETESSGLLPSFQAARVVAKDTQGNKFWCDGSTITKVNKDGAVVWVLTPPMKDSAGVIRAVHVDDVGNVFIGVSEGGVQSKARMWRFREQKSGPPKQEWQYPPDPETPILPGFFVEKLILRGDKLYALANYPDRWGAFLIVFAGALTTGPTEAWRKEVAYPARDFDLNAAGQIIGCSAAFATRGLDPRFRNFTQKTLDWTINDLTDAPRRVWVDLNAALIADKFNAGKSATDPTRLKSADAIPTFFDEGASARDFFTGQYELITAGLFPTDPLYAEHGIGAKPAIQFEGQQATGMSAKFSSAYQSGQSYSVTASASDAQRGLVPSYEGAKWCMFIVFAPEHDKTAATTEVRRGVWGQSIATGDTNPYLGLYSNRNSAGAEAGGIGSFADVVNALGVGVGTGTQPMHFDYSETNGNTCGGAGVLTILWDGGSTDTTEPGTHSLLRWNGKPLDRWKSLTGAFAGSLDPSNIGTTTAAFLASFKSFRGYIARIIVLRDQADAPEGLLSHPHYPWALHDAATMPTPAAFAVTDTEMERIEGMLGHEYGISHLFDSGAFSAPDFGGAPVAPWTPVNPGNWPHPYHLHNGPPRKSATATRSEAFQMHNPAGLVWKLDGAKGDIKWVCAPSAGVVIGGGMGTSVHVNPDGTIWSLGAAIQSDVSGTFSYESSPYNLRKIVDLNGDGLAGFEAGNTSGGGSMATRIDLDAVTPPYADPFHEHARITGDDKGNVYVPLSPSGTLPYSLRAYTFWPSATPGDAPHPSWLTSVQQPNILASYESAAGDTGLCVAVDPSPPYRFGPALDWDRAPSTVARTARAEFVYLGVSQPTPMQVASFYKARFVTATSVAGPPRTRTLFMVCDGRIVKFDSTGISLFAGASTLTGQILDPTAEFIAGCEAFGKFFLTDGKRYVYVDPILDGVFEWKATDGGSIALRRKLLENWRGRVVAARGVDEVSHWDMAELGDPFHWNLKTVPANSPTRAFKGEASRIGLAPDAINAIYSYSDNQLIALCDHSVWALTGDPADEGQPAGWRQMSDSIGGAFGRPGCKDPNGTFFFFGSRGGVYFMPPNLSLVSISPAPKSMTEDTIEQRLGEIDLTTFRPELCWNTEDDALHVWLIPVSGATNATHYRWLSRTKAWFEVETGFTVTAILNVDGDEADDRRLLIAGSDGYVRVWDSSVKNDDGTAFEVRALIGPIRPPTQFDTKREFRFRNLVCELAAEQDPVLVNVYGSNRPDDKGTVRWTGELKPGRTIIPVTITAGYVWVEIKQVHAQRRFAIESMEWEQVVPAGRMSVGS